MSHRLLLPLFALIAPVAAVGGCTGADDSGEPPPPRPSGQAATVCRALHQRLPENVDGQRRVTLTPESEFHAGWGDPAIRLRCGVPRPDMLSPGSEHYNPTAEAVGVNGVDWLVEEREDGHRFTTTARSVFVEVTVPEEYSPEVNPLTDLADPIEATVPENSL